jgi:hypothetical protein
MIHQLVACRVRFEIGLTAKPSEIRSYLENQKPHFKNFIDAFRLQSPEYYYKIGDHETQELDFLPDEVGNLGFKFIVESQSALTKPQAELLAHSANCFAGFWMDTNTSKVTVELDGSPILA